MPERAWRWAALASYVVFAVIAVGPNTLVTHGVVAGAGVDLPGTLWMHWWVRTTAEHFTLPISTNLLFYPDGKNFFDDTGANFIDAYLGIPLQWIFGVPDFIDPLDVVVLVGNAWALQALAMEITGGRLAASWAAAVAFELNPYAIQQIGEGRPTQAMLWFAVLATRSLVRLRQGTWRDGALFGLYTVLQGLTYWFMVYFLTLALLPMALVQLVQSPRRVAPRLALAVALALVIAAPFLIGIHAEIAAGHVTRLAVASWKDGSGAMAWRWALSWEYVVNATWLGVLALAVYRGRSTWPWLLGIAITLVFAVGPQLDIVTPPLDNPFYGFLWDHVPLLPRLGFPERVQSMTFILLAMCGAQGLASLDAVWAPLFVAVTLAEGLWRGTVPVQNTGFGDPGGNAYIREQGGAVIFVPFGADEDAMVFQTEHGQPLFGGMGEREKDLRPAGYQERLKNGFVIMLGATLNDTEPPIGYTLAEREEITRLFRWVWMDCRFAPPSLTALGYDRPGKIRRLSAELGRPVMGDETFQLWDLHADLPADAPGLQPTARHADHELERIDGAKLAPPVQADGTTVTPAGLLPANGARLPADGAVGPPLPGDPAPPVVPAGP